MRGRSQRARLSALLVAGPVACAMVLAGTLTAAQAAGGAFKYKVYKVPTDNSQPGSITLGSDGNLWFTEGAQFFTPGPDPDMGGTFHSQIGRITPSGEITEFLVDCDCFLGDIVQGPGELLYFASGDGLGRIGTDGAVEPFIQAPFSVGGQNLDARGSEVWITDVNGRSLWRYDITFGGFTEFPIGDGSLFGPTDLAVDASGSVWFGARGEGGVIGRLDPTVVDDPSTTNRENVETVDVAGTPNAVSLATDGKVWFTDRFDDTVGYVEPNDNQVSQFPTLTPEAGPQHLAAAPDGSMWFTQANIGNAARITADGVITEEGKAVGDDPDSGFENALGIAFRADPDGPAGPEAASVWFTMEAANKVAVLTQG